MLQWTWASATCRGTSHIKSNTRRQDALTCAVRGKTLCAVTSDGAGTASHGGEGASLICRFFGRQIRDHVLNKNTLPTDEDLWNWLDEVRDLIGACAQKRGVIPRNFAATLISITTDGNDTLVAHIGDGNAVARNAETGEWFCLSWPDQGEYASVTYFLTDDPPIHLRIYRFATQIDAVASFTDGIERLALDFARQVPHQPFFNKMIAPLSRSKAVGKDFDLSKHLFEFLMSEGVNSRTDDDKTLILALLK
jgi:hypothetical protein